MIAFCISPLLAKKRKGNLKIKFLIVVSSLQIDGGDYKPDKGRGSGGSQLIVQILVILENFSILKVQTHNFFSFDRRNITQSDIETVCLPKSTRLFVMVSWKSGPF